MQSTLNPRWRWRWLLAVLILPSAVILIKYPLQQISERNWKLAEAALEASRQALRAGAPDAAITQLKSYAALRVSWPYAWAGLAHAYAAAGIFDDRFAHALGRAAALGPYERNILRANLFLTTKHWLNLSPGVQSTVVHAVRHSLSVDRSGTLKILFQADKEDIVCRDPVRTQANLGQWCSNVRRVRYICERWNSVPQTKIWCRNRKLVSEARPAP